MGHKESKPSATLRYNFCAYGLTSEEGECLEKYFHQNSGRDRKLDEKEFQRIYSDMNPDIDHHKVRDIAKKVFNVADTNHDGRITFDEFLGFYILHKSTANHIVENMSSFLNNVNDDRGYITSNQAKKYVEFAKNYCEYSNNYSSSPAGTRQVFNDCEDDYVHIPIREFVVRHSIT